MNRWNTTNPALSNPDNRPGAAIQHLQVGNPLPFPLVPNIHRAVRTSSGAVGDDVIPRTFLTRPNQSQAANFRRVINDRSDTCGASIWLNGHSLRSTGVRVLNNRRFRDILDATQGQGIQYLSNNIGYCIDAGGGAPAARYPLRHAVHGPAAARTISAVTMPQLVERLRTHNADLNICPQIQYGFAYNFHDVHRNTLAPVGPGAVARVRFLPPRDAAGHVRSLFVRSAEAGAAMENVSGAVVNRVPIRRNGILPVLYRNTKFNILYLDFNVEFDFAAYPEYGRAPPGWRRDFITDNLLRDGARIIENGMSVYYHPKDSDLGYWYLYYEADVDEWFDDPTVRGVPFVHARDTVTGTTNLNDWSVPITFWSLLGNMVESKVPYFLSDVKTLSHGRMKIRLISVTLPAGKFLSVAGGNSVSNICENYPYVQPRVSSGDITTYRVIPEAAVFLTRMLPLGIPEDVTKPSEKFRFLSCFHMAVSVTLLYRKLISEYSGNMEKVNNCISNLQHDYDTGKGWAPKAIFDIAVQHFGTEGFGSLFIAANKSTKLYFDEKQIWGVRDIKETEIQTYCNITGNTIVLLLNDALYVTEMKCFNQVNRENRVIYRPENAPIAEDINTALKNDISNLAHPGSDYHINNPQVFYMLWTKGMTRSQAHQMWNNAEQTSCVLLDHVDAIFDTTKYKVCIPDPRTGLFDNTYGSKFCLLNVKKHGVKKPQKKVKKFCIICWRFHSNSAFANHQCVTDWCTKCHFAFTTADARLIHERCSTDPIVDLSKHPICSLCFSEERNGQHFLICYKYVEEMNTCSACNTVCCNEKCLEEHIKSVCNCNSVKCSLCGGAFVERGFDKTRKAEDLTKYCKPDGNDADFIYYTTNKLNASITRHEHYKYFCIEAMRHRLPSIDFTGKKAAYRCKVCKMFVLPPHSCFMEGVDFNDVSNLPPCVMREAVMEYQRFCNKNFKRRKQSISFLYWFNSNECSIDKSNISPEMITAADVYVSNRPPRPLSIITWGDSLKKLQEENTKYYKEIREIIHTAFKIDLTKTDKHMYAWDIESRYDSPEGKIICIMIHFRPIHCSSNPWEDNAGMNIARRNIDIENGTIQSLDPTLSCARQFNGVTSAKDFLTYVLGDQSAGKCVPSQLKQSSIFWAYNGAKFDMPMIFSAAIELGFYPDEPFLSAGSKITEMSFIVYNFNCKETTGNTPNRKSNKDFIKVVFRDAMLIMPGMGALESVPKTLGLHNDQQMKKLLKKGYDYFMWIFKPIQQLCRIDDYNYEEIKYDASIHGEDVFKYNFLPPPDSCPKFNYDREDRDKLLKWFYDYWLISNKNCPPDTFWDTAPSVGVDGKNTFMLSYLKDCFKYKSIPFNHWIPQIMKGGHPLYPRFYYETIGEDKKTGQCIYESDESFKTKWLSYYWTFLNPVFERTTDIDYDLIQLSKLYNANDTLVLSCCVAAFQVQMAQNCNADVCNHPTIASMAMKDYVYSHLPSDFLISRLEFSVNELARQPFYGGRNEIFRPYFISPLVEWSYLENQYGKEFRDKYEMESSQQTNDNFKQMVFNDVVDISLFASISIYKGGRPPWISKRYWNDNTNNFYTLEESNEKPNRNYFEINRFPLIISNEISFEDFRICKEHLKNMTTRKLDEIQEFMINKYGETGLTDLKHCDTIMEENFEVGVLLLVCMLRYCKHYNIERFEAAHKLIKLSANLELFELPGIVKFIALKWLVSTADDFSWDVSMFPDSVVADDGYDPIRDICPKFGLSIIEEMNYCELCLLYALKACEYIMAVDIVSLYPHVQNTKPMPCGVVKHFVPREDAMDFVEVDIKTLEQVCKLTTDFPFVRTYIDSTENDTSGDETAVRKNLFCKIMHSIINKMDVIGANYETGFACVRLLPPVMTHPNNLIPTCTVMRTNDIVNDFVFEEHPVYGKDDPEFKRNFDFTLYPEVQFPCLQMFSNQRYAKLYNSKGLSFEFHHEKIIIPNYVPSIDPNYVDVFLKHRNLKSTLPVLDKQFMIPVMPVKTEIPSYDSIHERVQDAKDKPKFCHTSGCIFECEQKLKSEPENTSFDTKQMYEKYLKDKHRSGGQTQLSFHSREIDRGVYSFIHLANAIKNGWIVDRVYWMVTTDSSTNLFKSYIGESFRNKLIFAGFNEKLWMTTVSLMIIDDSQNITDMNVLLTDEGFQRVKKYFVDKNNIYMKSVNPNWTDVTVEELKDEGNPGNKVVAKFKLTSLWGKFAQGPQPTKKFVTSEQLAEITALIIQNKIHLKNIFPFGFDSVNPQLDETDSMLIEFWNFCNDSPRLRKSNLLLAATVTSEAQTLLTKRLMEVERPNYCDTDSVFSTEVPFAKESNLIGFTLGKFLCESVDPITVMCCIAPKMYSIVVDSTKELTKFRGFYVASNQKQTIDTNSFYKLIREPSQHKIESERLTFKTNISKTTSTMTTETRTALFPPEKTWKRWFLWPTHDIQPIFNLKQALDRFVCVHFVRDSISSLNDVHIFMPYLGIHSLPKCDPNYNRHALPPMKMIDDHKIQLTFYPYKNPDWNYFDVFTARCNYNMRKQCLQQSFDVLSEFLNHDISTSEGYCMDEALHTTKVFCKVNRTHSSASLQSESMEFIGTQDAINSNPSTEPDKRILSKLESANDNQIRHVVNFLKNFVSEEVNDTIVVKAWLEFLKVHPVKAKRRILTLFNLNRHELLSDEVKFIIAELREQDIARFPENDDEVMHILSRLNKLVNPDGVNIEGAEVSSSEEELSECLRKRSKPIKHKTKKRSHSTYYMNDEAEVSGSESDDTVILSMRSSEEEIFNASDVDSDCNNINFYRQIDNF